MYKNIEIETSYNYLKIILSKLNEPICILGGWAVFFTVNKNFQRNTGRIYLGSRDIDLGFDTVESFKEAANIFENELKFELISFRYFKNIHAETGKELSEEEAKKLPAHMMFPMYVDPIISRTSKEISSKLGFSLIDEPLLRLVFKNKENRTELKEFSRKLWLPSPGILLATKFNAIVNRDKSHKVIKDACDIVALCLFSELNINKLINDAIAIASKDNLRKFKSILGKEEVTSCANLLGLEKSTTEEVFGKIDGFINKISN